MIIIAFLFIILGILIKYGKMYFLIAGYNTMSKEEKEKYDIEGIATVFRNGMIGIGLIVIVGYVIAYLTNNESFKEYFFLASMIIGVPYLLIQSNSKKSKFK